MMGHSHINHDRIIESAKAVSTAYLALDLARNFHLTCEDKPTTLSELLGYLGHLPGTEVTLSINGNGYNFTSLPSTAEQRAENPDVKYFQISRVGGNKALGDLRQSSDYLEGKSEDIDEVMSIFTNAPIGVQINSDSPSVLLTAGDKKLSLNSRHKEDLYPSHLSVINAIIQHLRDPDALAKNLNNLLIAYPTGSGKTFIQAIWFLILYHARISGVFALPENSIHQYISDFKRLLPASLVAELVSINATMNKATASTKQASSLPDKDKGELYDEVTENVETAAPDIGLSEKLFTLNDPLKPRYFVGSHQDALSTYFTTFNDADNLVFCIDEHHKAVEIEAQKIAVLKLAENKLCMFLTATPDEATYTVCGKPVAIMSQKSFSEIHVVRAKGLDDYRKETKSGRAIVMAVVNALEPLPVSTAAAILSELPFVAATREIAGKDQLPDRQARWNFTPMLSRKALVCASESVDDLINFSRFAHSRQTSEFDKTPNLLATIYSDGNMRQREFAFHITRQKTKNANGEAVHTANRDLEHATAYLAMKKKKLDDATPEVIRNNENLQIPLTIHESANNSIFHGLNEILVRAVLAYDPNAAYALANFKRTTSQYLNARRLADLDSLIEEFKNKLYLLSHLSGNSREYFANLLTYHQDHNPAGIDAQGAATSAILLNSMLESSLSENNHNLLPNIVDNWNLDRSFQNICLLKPGFKYQFDDFTTEHRTVFIMSGMDESETPIETGRPFKKFRYDIVSIRNPDGSFNTNAKKRTLNMSEYFDPTADEYHYKPDYYDSSMTEFLIDNYFRLGLKGFLVSNRKSEAFNDRGLTNVISLIAHNGDKNNKPSQVVQQIGRNRDLDKTQISMVAQIYAKEAEPVLDAAALKTTHNFLPDLFKAERRYKKFLIVKLGKSIAAEIKSWFVQSTDGKEQVVPALFRKTVLQSLLEKMRSLNIQNDHRLNQTKSDFEQSIKVAQKSLRETINKLKHSFTKNFIVKAAYVFTHIVAVFFSLRRISTAIKFYRKAAADKKALAAMNADDPLLPQLRKDVAYAKVIRAHSLNQTYQQSMIAVQFHRVLERKIAILKNTVLDDPMPLLDANAISLINELTKNNLLPLLVRFFPKDHQSRLLAIAQGYTGWDKLIAKLRNDFSELGDLKNADMQAMSAPLLKLSRSMFMEIPEIADEVANMQQVDYIQLANVAKSAFLKPIDELTNNHAYLIAKLETFLKKSFSTNIALCMPVRYSALIQDILYSGDNAAQFATILINNQHNQKTSEFNLENSFNLFRDHFKRHYLDLDDIENLNSIKENAIQQMSSISDDLNKIMLNQDPVSTDQGPSSPLTTSKTKRKASKLKAALSKKVSKGKAVLRFIANKSDIKDTLADYFNTDFLDKMTQVLPKSEYDIITSLFSDRTHCHTFATYLYKNARRIHREVNNARRIHREVNNDSSQFIGYLKDCFKDTPFIASLNEFRSAEEIQQSLASVTHTISSDLAIITDDYAKHKREEIASHYNHLFQQPQYAAYLADLFHLTGSSVEPNETTEQAIFRLMNQPQQPNAASFANYMVREYETWKQDPTNTDEPPIDLWFSEHFSQQELGIQYKAVFMHIHAETAFNTLRGMQNNITDFIDFEKLSYLTRTHIRELLVQPDVVKLIQFYLKDLNEDDIAALLSENDSGNFENYKAQAQDLILLKNAVSSGRIESLPADFFMPTNIPASSSASEDAFTQKISTTRLYRASHHLSVLMKAVTEHQCYYHRTFATGGGQSSYSHSKQFNPDDIRTIRVPGVDSDSIGDICWSLNFMQAQLKSSPAQDRLNAFADRYTIESYQRASDHMMQPFSTVFNASNLGLSLWRGFKSIGTSIKQFFYGKEDSLQSQDTAVSTDIASSIQQRTPLTWAKVNTHLQKHARQPSRRPHQDAIVKTIQKLDALTREQTKPVSILTRPLLPHTPNPPTVAVVAEPLIPVTPLLA